MMESARTLKSKHSLTRRLLVWFLLFALLPLSLTAWLGYRQAVNGLMAAVTQELVRGASENIRFINNWFNYRFMDLNSQSENRRNVEFLLTLQNAMQTSGKDLPEFVSSNAWAVLVADRQQDLVSLARRYDYIHDLFLIDLNGNILFTVAHESDLGTNLFNGPHADSRFSRSAKISLNTGQARFSDLEYYGPSKNLLAGFLTAPMLNEQGDKVGLFAIQLRLERINALILNTGDSSLTHYLVGEDGLLRTPIRAANKDAVLRRQIQMAALGEMGSEGDAPAVFNYRGPKGQEVIGLQKTVSLPGVNWILVSEVDEDEALQVARDLGQMIVLIFLFTAAVVAAGAMYQARRITRPIIALAKISRAVTAGDVDQRAVVTANNEIGELAEAFNDMLLVRKQHMDTLEESNRIAQTALAELAEQRYALDQHAIVAITDRGGTISFVNDKFSEISGYPREALLGQNHRMLKSGHHDKAFFTEMYHTISSGEVWHGEVCNRAKDGHLYWVATTIVPFMGKDGKPQSYIAIRTDVTARKCAEMALLEAKETAEAATQQKSEFLANMSHEIRTPMNGIVGMTSLLQDTQLTPKQRSYTEATMSSANALLTLINDILDFSKIEAGKLALEQVAFDLQYLVEDIARLMALKCHEKGLEIVLHYKPGTVKFVLGDPSRVRQVLLNLLSNAMKFTDQGHILLTVESYGGTDGMMPILLTVQDTGIGVAEDKLERIFNKFDQEDSSTTRKYGGTGLGLSICKQLCHLMGGDIQVHSKKGRGSDFSFTLNLAVNNAVDIPELSSPKYSNNCDSLEGLNALIVDDMAIVRTVITEQLSALGMRTCGVACAKDALATLAQAGPFDVVLIDADMPGMTTEALAMDISQRQLLLGGVMVLMTSMLDEDAAIHLKALGFDACLTKPVIPSEIVQILSLIWTTKQQGQTAALVTRYSLQGNQVVSHIKAHFSETHILLAEDTPVNVMVATEMLASYGCTVTVASNGLEALALVKARQFDLILMDCQMPEMDGFEATKNIRLFQVSNAIDPVPIIACTANAMASDQDKCLSAGMDDYLSKPMSQGLLENTLKKWLSHKLQAFNPEEGEVVEALDELDLGVFNTLKQLFGDKFIAAVEQHTQSALDNIKRVELAVEQEDVETLVRAAHSLKGASAQFGAMRLSALALDMECLAKNKELKKVKRLLVKLRAAQVRAVELMTEHE